MSALSHTGAVLIAGGKSTRFGGEKAVADFNGRPLMDTAIERFAGCAAIAVSAPPHAAAAAHARAQGLAVLHDDPSFPEGPLAGICAGLEWAQARDFAHLAVAPCDTPLTPRDLYETLAAHIGAAEAAYATSASGDHPLCALWRVSLLG